MPPDENQASKEFTNTNSILGVTKSLYLNNITSDVRFVFVIDKTVTVVPAHKIMLASYSPVFHAMFYGDLKESGDIKIVDVSINGFKDFLTIFYLDTVKITSENVAQFTYLCDKYNVPRGLEMCEDFLLENSKIDDVCTHLTMAVKYNLKLLQIQCEEKIRVNAVEVFKLDGFIDVNVIVLKVILQIDDLNCLEEDIFNACIKWAENACVQDNICIINKQNLRRKLRSCFYLIPFTTMKIENFVQIVTSNRTLFSQNEILDIQNCIVSGTPSEFSEKFKMNDDAAVLTWCDKSMIECVRDSKKWLDIWNKQYITFSSSQKLLFGGFKFHPIAKKPGPNWFLKGNIYITKRMDSIQQNKLLNEIRLLSHIDRDETHLPSFMFEKPIVIIPNVKYTIYIDFTNNHQNKKGLLKQWIYLGDEHTTTSILEKNIRIEFHDDSEADYYNAMYSIVSKLYFNHI